MTERVWIDVACNNPNNGLFDRRARAINLRSGSPWSGGELITIEPDSWGGYSFAEGDGFVRLHRRKFEIVGGKHWIGNWGWNGYLFERAEAKRFLRTLRDSGRWRCTCAVSHFYRWFNGLEEKENALAEARMF